MTEMTIKNIFCLLTASFTLVACTSYGGLTPDYSLAGADAQQEVDDFTIKPGAWGTPMFEMGKKTYYMDSMQPLFANVSDQGAKTLDKAIWLERASWATLGGAFLVLMLQGSSVTTADRMAFFGLLGATGGIVYVQNKTMGQAAEQYNQDLRQKFAPTLGWNFEF
jgi:hypothetical protein